MTDHTATGLLSKKRSGGARNRINVKEGGGGGGVWWGQRPRYG